MISFFPTARRDELAALVGTLEAIGRSQVATLLATLGPTSTVPSDASA